MANIVVNKENSQILSFTREGDAVDALFFTVKKANLPTAYLLQKTLEDATFEDGKYSIPLSVADLADLNTGASYRYDIQINVGEDKTTIAKGCFIVKDGAVSADGSSVSVEISMTRGDTKILKFQRKNDQDEVITGLPTAMDFTFADVHKTLEDMTQDIDGTFRLKIKPEDTDGLDFGSYPFRLTVTDMGITSTISAGNIILTEEVTFAANER